MLTIAATVELLFVTQFLLKHNNKEFEICWSLIGVDAYFISGESGGGGEPPEVVYIPVPLSLSCTMNPRVGSGS